MGKTKIDWCDESINFITGCKHGCEFCYAKRTAERNARMGSKRYVDAQEYGGHPFRPTYHHDIMERELARLSRATRPRVVFIGSMSDPAQNADWMYLDGTGRGGGHQLAGSVWVQEMIAAFARRLPKHTFILLTKAPKNLISGWPSNVVVGTSVTSNMDASRVMDLRASVVRPRYDEAGQIIEGSEPRPPLLCASVEPLLDPDFAEDTFLEGLDWVIVGAQTGPKARLGRVTGWERDEHGVAHDKTAGQFIAGAAKRIVEWCAPRGVPCFVKENLTRIEPGYNWPHQYPAAFEGRGR